MRKVMIVRGAPGSGKSTFVKHYINDIVSQETFAGVAHFEADMYFDNDGVYEFDRSKIRCAHEWCFNSFSEALRNDVNLIFVSNTFTKLWELQNYVDHAKDMGYKVDVYHLKRIFGNVHNVPEEIVQRMINTYEPYDGEIEVE